MSQAQEKLRSGITSDPRVNYDDRIKYSTFVEIKQRELGIEFLDTIEEFPLYGFIDREYYIVEPNAELIGFGDYAGDLKGLNYVVSCFNEFRTRFLELSRESDAFNVPASLNALVPKKSYLDISEDYSDLQRLAAEVFVEPFILGRYSQGFLNFSSFVDALDEIIFDDDKKQYKITKSGFVLSTFAKAYHSGLYVDLAPGMNPSIDYQKVDLISDPSYKCFAQMANDYGFYLDKNCPWRLILNLSSRYAQENIRNGNFSREFYDFYSEEYLMRTGPDDYWNLKSFYKRMYLKYSIAKGKETVQTLEYNSIPEERWIKTYVINRLREIGEFRNVDFYSSDDSPTEGKKTLKKILTSALERYNIISNQNLQQLSHNSGVILYIEDQCAKLLEERIKRAKIDSTDT